MKSLWMTCFLLGVAGNSGAETVRDQIVPLPPNAVHFNGYFEDCIQNSIAHWNKGVAPYAALVQMFRTGRGEFAQGEMWGKAVRSGCMFYRSHLNPIQVNCQTVDAHL